MSSRGKVPGRSDGDAARNGAIAAEGANDVPLPTFTGPVAENRDAVGNSHPIADEQRPPLMLVGPV